MTVFAIAPAESRYLWFLLPVALLMIGVLVILVLSLRGSKAPTAAAYSLLLSPSDPDAFLTALRSRPQ